MSSEVSLLLRHLNPEQRAAVCQSDGPVLVLAGAGSGKTRVITTRIAYLIEQGLAQPSGILALTFTNRAAAEMRERVARIVGTDLSRSIVLSTFHSFCVRVLRAEIERLGYRRNFTISSASDARTLLRRCVEDLDGVRESLDPGRLLDRIGMMKSAGLEPGERPTVAAPPETDAQKAETQAKYDKWLPEVFERYESALRAANSLDFDDLLGLTLRLWQEHPRVLARYQKHFGYVMVDEYQDTNRVQYKLLRALVDRSRNLCVVGDDDQSIYSWRGADVGNILSFEKDFPDAKVIKLEQNYRSTETILEAANAVIAHNTARRAKNLWSRNGLGRAVDWFVTADDEHEAKEAVGLVRHIRSKTGAAYRSFAVLYRSNQQSRPFEIALRQAAIPYTVFGGPEFFDRVEVKDLLAYLKIIANPRDEPSLLRVVNVPRRGIGDATLHRVHEICRQHGVSTTKGLRLVLEGGGLASNTAAGVREFLGLVSLFRKRFRDCGGRLAGTAMDLVDATRYRDEVVRVCKTAGQFEARWGNLEALIAAIANYEERADSPTLTGFLDESALARDDDQGNRQERRTEGVCLTTIHSAKGLEFPFVLIAGVEEGLLPHEKSVGDRALEEERRLFYVALTRAQRHVALFEALAREGRGRRRMTRTSRFVAEMPQERVKQRIRAARDRAAADSAHTRS